MPNPGVPQTGGCCASNGLGNYQEPAKGEHCDADCEFLQFHCCTPQMPPSDRAPESASPRICMKRVAPRRPMLIAYWQFEQVT